MYIYIYVLALEHRPVMNVGLRLFRGGYCNYHYYIYIYIYIYTYYHHYYCYYYYYSVAGLAGSMMRIKGAV